MIELAEQETLAIIWSVNFKRPLAITTDDVKGYFFMKPWLVVWNRDLPWVVPEELIDGD